MTSFLGKGWGFPPQFDLGSGSVRMVAEEEDIRESLNILMSTRPGERVMQPGYGCGLNALVFDTMSSHAVALITDTIRRAVLFYEPRIDLENITFDDSDIHEGLVRIELEYRVRTTNSRSNIVFPFYFQEGTNL